MDSLDDLIMMSPTELMTKYGTSTTPGRHPTIQVCMHAREYASVRSDRWGGAFDLVLNDTVPPCRQAVAWFLLSSARR